MAKLVDVYSSEDQILHDRQLPLFIDENLSLVLDLSGLGFNFKNPIAKGADIDEFLRMFKLLSAAEVRDTFSVDRKEFFATLGQNIPCVGCRRSVESLYEKIRKSGHPVLEPLLITSSGTLTVKEDNFQKPRLLCALLHGHSIRLNQLVERQFKSKKSGRCVLHCLDYHAPWKEIWDMDPQCREKALRIDSSSLMATLVGYMKKHKFGGDCRTLVLRAYRLLVEELQPTMEEGYVPELYWGIKRCIADKHIHLPSDLEYVTSLVSRAEPDVIGALCGETHALTMEFAQGEVITCLGLHVCDRLQRIQVRLKEEETAFQVLTAVAIEALGRKFQMVVDTKKGITKMELLDLELTQQEVVKRKRKGQRKLKNKKRRERKAGTDSKAEYSPVGNVFEESACSSKAFGDTKENCIREASPSESSGFRPSGKNSQILSVIMTSPAMNANSRHEKNGDNVHRKTGINSRKCSLKGTMPPEAVSSCLNPTESCIATTSFVCPKRKHLVEKDKRTPACEYKQDCGYSCGNNNANSLGPCSLETSEVACEESCNDEEVCGKTVDPPPEPQFKYQPTAINDQRFLTSLEQMLEDEGASSDEESCIPLEDVQQFQSQDNISQKREELRKNLRVKFALMCNDRLKSQSH